MKIIANTAIKISKKIFNEVYLPYLSTYDKRFEVYYGGSGSGKSVFVTQKLLYKYLKYPNRKCLIIRKVNNTLKDSCFALFKSIISDWQIYDQCKINKTDLTIELPNGSQFIMKGLDDPERIKSIANIDDIWVEECTEIDDFDFDQLCLRLRSKNPYNQVFVSFNPISKSNWVYKRWFAENATYNKSNTSVLHTTYKDNKFLPQSYIDNLLEMEKTNNVYYKIYALGEFATLDKLVYTNWRVEGFDYLELLKGNRNTYAIFGTDFGYTNDYTTLICSVIDEVDKKLYIYDEHFETHMTNEDIFKMYTEKHVVGERIVCDSSEPKSIEELKRLGCKRVVGATKGKDSIINGIQLIQQYEIIVHPNCKMIQEELKNYTWIKDKATNEYINKPIDKYNHGLDALRYSIMDKIGKKRSYGTLTIGSITDLYA
ncbi:PBSX family phage terminase large subunit [Clostridium sp.]|uniref:PBSX family phage terminase large subunit n=1 Tax=Clostridium sp. TaxID=1506 RepID=UPI00262325B8|nr:PBSX family phage terminase large subunit [Clostridium sp.]